jgi:hypothetical protein
MGVDYTTCHPASAIGHKYIIVSYEYLTKWVEAMPTYSNDEKTTSIFLFNHVIARFGCPKHIIIDHGSHFQNTMMTKLLS